ncbi:hypothetical protein CCO04_12170 [Pimelobacter sp. 30-1]|nr:hypothetical protein [Pimelobacter sp. 30-1]
MVRPAPATGPVHPLGHVGQITRHPWSAAAPIGGLAPAHGSRGQYCRHGKDAALATRPLCRGGHDRPGQRPRRGAGHRPGHGLPGRSGGRRRRRRAPPGTRARDRRVRRA